MGNLIDWSAECGVEFRHTMTMDVAPERRDAVEIGIAVEIIEEAALGRSIMSGFRGV